MKALSTVRALSGVRRAWPGRDGSITFELTAPAGKLRAGRVNRSFDFLSKNEMEFRKNSGAILNAIKKAR